MGGRGGVRGNRWKERCEAKIPHSADSQDFRNSAFASLEKKQHCWHIKNRLHIYILKKHILFSGQQETLTCSKPPTALKKEVNTPTLQKIPAENSETSVT